MVQSAKLAVTKDAQLRLKKEECVTSMVQSASAKLAVTNDASNRPRQEECVDSMVQSTNLAARRMHKSG